MELKEFLACKDELEKKRESFNRLQGKLSVLLQQLENEFRCPSIIDAEKTLHEKQVELLGIEAEYREKLRCFKGEFHEKLT